MVDRRTGEIREAEIFVAVLGASSYSYAEATWTQMLPDSGLYDELRPPNEFLGGIAEIWVPNQLRRAVSGPTPPTRDQPPYHELAEHHGALILPAPPNKPKDEAKAEVAVQVVQRRILARIRSEVPHEGSAVGVGPSWR